MAESKGGPQAQARARTVFPQTGGTIIGGVLPPSLPSLPGPRPSRPFPHEAVFAMARDKLEASLRKRLGDEKVDRMIQATSDRIVALRPAAPLILPPRSALEPTRRGPVLPTLEQFRELGFPEDAYAEFVKVNLANGWVLPDPDAPDPAHTPPPPPPSDPSNPDPE